LLVVLYHLTEFRFQTLLRPLGSGPLTTEGPQGIGSWISKQILRELEYAGPLGVQIFFTISGFIITTLLMREQQRNGRVSLSAFYVRRALRILPPLWLVLGTVILFASLGYIRVGQRSLLLAASFLCNTQPNNCSWFTGHTWSLAIEEQFYLVWPLLLTTIGFRAIAPLALTVCLVFIAVDQTSFMTAAWLHNALSGACVAAGALYASSSRFRALLLRASTLPTILAAAFLLFGAPFFRRYNYYFVESILTPFLIVFLVFSFSRFRANLEHRLIIRTLAGLGLISYGLYLWQQLFLADPSSYILHSLLEYPALLVPVVAISYWLVEKPLVRLGARLSRYLTSRAPAAAINATTAS
jgi:peptidoglycan/LPS O-acetylase OafA/YrhL